MRTLGSPKIRVADCGDHYFALEGTHRIEAARRLALPIILDIRQGNSLLDVGQMDIAISWDDELPEMEMRVDEVVAKLRCDCNGEYWLSDDGTPNLIRAAPKYYIPPL